MNERESIDIEAVQIVDLALERLKSYADSHPETKANRLKAAGVSESFFRDLQRGKTGRGVTLMTVVRVALALDVEPMRLLEREPRLGTVLRADELIEAALEGAVVDPLDADDE